MHEMSLHLPDRLKPVPIDRRFINRTRVKAIPQKL